MSKKGENIYKRKDNRWEARYVKGYGTDGMAKYGYCYGKTYKEAKQKVTVAKSALIISKPADAFADKKCFEFYCDEWLLINRSRVKESTYVKYNTILENHIKPRLGHYPVQAVSALTVEQFSHELLYDEGLSPKTVKDILTTLHSIIKYIVKQFPGQIQMIDIVYPKDPKKEMRVLSREEQTLLVQYLTEDTDECKFGVLLALLTGMRIGEICALKWENISLIDRIVKISSTMQRIKDFADSSTSKTKVVISNPKSDTSLRIIPLTDYAVALCKKYASKNPYAYVLTGEENRYIEPRTMQYRLERYTKECGLEGVHFHTLRHTFATRCVEVEFEIKSLSEILGHSSPRITVNIRNRNTNTFNRQSRLILHQYLLA